MKKIIVLLITVFCLCLPFTAFAKTPDSNGLTKAQWDEVWDYLFSQEKIVVKNADKKTYPYCTVYASGHKYNDLNQYIATEITVCFYNQYQTEKFSSGKIGFTAYQDSSAMCPTWVYNLETGKLSQIGKVNTFYYDPSEGVDATINAVMYQNNCNFDYEGDRYNSFFTMDYMTLSMPTLHPSQPTDPPYNPTPLPALTEGTGVEVVQMGATKIVEVLKMVILAVFGVLCLILLSPLVKRFLNYLKSFITRL